MKKINFLPTKITYNEKTKQIEMYYRKQNSNDLHKACIDFDYYIYVSPDYLKYGTVEEDEIYQLINTGEPLVKAYMTYRDAKEIYRNGNYLTGEGDVSPEQRFSCDTFYDVEFPANIKPRIYFLDIETYSTDNIIPRFNHNVAEISAITIYDTYTSKYYCWFLVPENKRDNFENYYDEVKEAIKEYGDSEIKLFTSPKNLIASFSRFLVSDCPDIITAWNSPFDIPYIMRKLIDHFGVNYLKCISPFKKISSKVTSALDANDELKIDTLIPGIDIIDLMALYKKYTPGQKPSYSLKAITEEELGETKLTSDDGDSDPNHMYENDFVSFCKYNVQDVRLMYLLEQKCKILELSVTIRNICKTTYQDTFHESSLLDNLFIMEMIIRRNNNDRRVLPSRNPNAEKKKYLGAYVKETLKGRWPWVADLDFKSLYPSVVKTFKLSNESVVGVIDKKQLFTLYSIAKCYKIDDLVYIFNEMLPKYMSYDADLIDVIETYKKTAGCAKPSAYKKYGEDLVINVEYYPLYCGMDFPNKFDNMSSFIDWLKENNYAILPNGVIVDQNKDDALAAKIIADLMNNRSKYKDIMLEYRRKGDYVKEATYDMYQLAMKRLNNSCYGVLAMSKFRMIDVNIADAITTSGQLIIRTSTYLANRHLNEAAGTVNEDYVLTNDTDSIIFTLRGLTDEPITTRDPAKLAEIAAHSKNCQDYVNDSIYDICKNIFYKFKVNKSNNFLTIKNEWLASTGLFVAKKMYVIYMVFNEGIPKEALKPTGISLKRASTPMKLKPFIENVIRAILSYKNKEDVDVLVINECNKMKNEYSISDIAIPSSLQDIDGYDNMPIHVRGITIWNNYFAPTEKDKVLSGKIKYFYVKSWDNNKLNFDKEYVLSVPNVNKYWSLVEGRANVDYDKMKERLILKPIGAFYDALNWKLPKQTVVSHNNIFGSMFHK